MFGQLEQLRVTELLQYWQHTILSPYLPGKKMGKRLEGRGKGEYERGKEEREEVGCEQGTGNKKGGERYYCVDRIQTDSKVVNGKYSAS